jgi:hypothetical protein
MPNNKNKSKINSTLFTINARHPRPLVTVHFVSSEGIIQNVYKIPYNILLEYNYYVEKENGHFTVEDEYSIRQESQSAYHNRYYMNIKDRKNIIEDATVKIFGVKDGLTRKGYQQDVQKNKYANEFIKAINTQTSQYITIFKSDLDILNEETVNKNFKIRAVITDATGKEHVRQIKLNNEDWQELYNNNKVDLIKLNNEAKNKNFVLDGTTLPNLTQSRVGLLNLNDVVNSNSTLLPSMHKTDRSTSSTNAKGTSVSKTNAKGTSVSKTNGKGTSVSKLPDPKKTSHIR